MRILALAAASRHSLALSNTLSTPAAMAGRHGLPPQTRLSPASGGPAEAARQAALLGRPGRAADPAPARPG